MLTIGKQQRRQSQRNVAALKNVLKADEKFTKGLKVACCLIHYQSHHLVYDRRSLVVLYPGFGV